MPPRPPFPSRSLPRRPVRSRQETGGGWEALDRFSGGLILLAVIFGPWAFGTTQRWSIQTMNIVGILLWSVLGLKGFLRHRERQWGLGGTVGAATPECPSERTFSRWLAVLTFLVLAYCGISALNARATYRPESWSFAYHSAIRWLPHSYDSESSVRLFWVYLGIAGIFWAARDWILNSPELRAPPSAPPPTGARGGAPLPSRMRLLLWVLSVNGAVLGLESILQRVVGTNRLLGLVETRINNDALSQFGPYAYRSNAAQYFNLLWPVTLGFWLTHQRAQRFASFVGPVARWPRHHLLLSCALVMAVCPVMSTSRGGAIVMVLSALLCGVVFFLAKWRSTWGAKLALFLLLGGMVGGGVLLGWEELSPRMEVLKEGYDARETINLTGRRMAADNPVFGVGPGSFNHLFQLYRSSPDEYWPAQLHNDWLETLITFGWVGSSLLAAGLIAVLARWFLPGKCPGDKYFMMTVWIALAGCLLHARFDFPFQIHSILTLFLLLCGMASCLSRKV